ncbi:MAG: VWD domain-containing protein [Bacteroidota bacterium]
MIKQYIPISLLAMTALFGSQAVAQEQFTKDFETVRKELVSWDPVRGEWLSSSLVAMTKNEPIPDRMFPEDFTPLEMLKVVPASTRNAIAETATSQSNNGETTVTDRQSWSTVSSVLDRANCKPVMGRTYGDPHLASFDGASYSFQTVGEFILVKSTSGNMEVQTRQRAQTDDISLNTAVAMNVAGDRFCVYAQEKPDGNTSTPIRLNGDAIYVDELTYYLPHGGTVRRSGRNNYLVTWPTGETASLDIHNGAFSFINVSVQVFPCADSYEGVLGNANGRSSDDFETRGNASRPDNLAFHTFGNTNDPAAQAMEREYLAWMSKDFAGSWRVEQPTSLFDYGFGQSTLTFTDESFPRVHHTLADLSQDDRDRARRNCERNGVSAIDMNGCIYDQGFVNIPPSPRPEIVDRTVAYNVTPITNPVPNVNPGGSRIPRVEGSGPGKGDGAGGNGAVPMGKQVGSESAAPNTEARTPETNGGVVPKPVDTEGTIEKPAPVVVDTPKKPAPVPVEEEKPERSRLGRLFETVSGSGSSGSESGSGSSSPRTSSPEPRYEAPEPTRSEPRYEPPAPQRSEPRYEPPAPRSEPVSRPEPVSTPAPRSTPTVGRGGGR